MSAPDTLAERLQRWIDHDRAGHPLSYHEVAHRSDLIALLAERKAMREAIQRLLDNEDTSLEAANAFAAATLKGQTDDK